MNEKIKADIIGVLDSALGLLEKKDSSELSELSNHTIHNASIFQDKDSVTIAVVIYALSKVIDRMGRIEQDVFDYINKAIASLKSDDLQAYESSIKDIVDAVSSVDKKMNLYVQHIIDQAGIKKGSRLYGHGISVAQTAEVFNISQWELMKYLGQTNIPEEFADEVDITTRLGFARKIFSTG
ncbi:hypothetical protein JXB31_01275, partial [Candidatus Woesearchaeota archaeon]|nr:hypothetical protein [Candidatus Woesearchaeota archaeon]